MEQSRGEVARRVGEGSDSDSFGGGSGAGGAASAAAGTVRSAAEEGPALPARTRRGWVAPMTSRPGHVRSLD